MALLHHHHDPAPERAGVVLAFLVGFAVALVPSAILAFVVVPSLVPLGREMLGSDATIGMTIGTAAAVGLATAVGALARTVSRR